MERKPLSPRQAKLLDVLEHLTHRKGYPPSTREIAEVMGVQQAAVTHLLARLERFGWVTLDRGIARSAVSQRWAPGPLGGWSNDLLRHELRARGVAC